MRNELLQERASRQDLECDKIALERQVHTPVWRITATDSVQNTHSFHLSFHHIHLICPFPSFYYLYTDMIMV